MTCLQRILFGLFLAIAANLGGPPVSAETRRDQPFDSDWRFHRGEAAGAALPWYDDSQWRKLDLPHDWSIEDLPPRQDAILELEVVTGEWRFQRGDESQWKTVDFDDSQWQQVTLPSAWEKHSGYTIPNAYGWFRRKIEVPAKLRGEAIELLLGRIDDADEVWLNGKRIGGTGSFPPNYQTAWDAQRRYRVPASIVKGDGTDVLAVRVFDGDGEGGIYAAGSKSVRIGPFDPRESENADKTGYVVGGVGWYRKHFKTNNADRRVAVRFDGVYMNADVWINGHQLGTHRYGYTPFEYELTSYLNPPGENNLLAVRVRNEGKNSRWYSGSGIYRHVWLTTTGSIHMPTWGVFVTTPEVSEKEAVVDVSTEVCNTTSEPHDAIVQVSISDPEGRLLHTAESEFTLPAKETSVAEFLILLESPKQWSPDKPQLYQASVEVIVAGEVADKVATPFGIRSIEFSADRGFLLNGKPMLLKGGCIHHDNGPLGAAAIDRAEERKIELLKSNGFNAVRSSHNPPSSALLAACDRLGMLVIDEAFDQWHEHKLDNTADYSQYFQQWHQRDIAAMVRRDRNHPSVIMWSIGNEIPEQFRAEDTQKKLRDLVLQHDNSRPVTQAICTDWGPVIQDWDRLSDPAFTHLDVAGYNYLPNKYETDHARHPRRVMYGSESYAKDAFEYWSLVEKHPYVIGDFVWTAQDYLGESGIAHAVLDNQPNPFFMSWPWHNAWCGDLDLCGFKKPQSFYRDVVWRESPLEMVVHTPIPAGRHEVLSWWGWPDQRQSWNWAGHEGQPLEVSVYSRCERVRLELNGELLGEKPVSEETKLTAKFTVPYAAGKLRAVGLIDGKQVAEKVLRTSGEPKSLKLTVDRSNIAADRNDLAFVTVEVVDDRGQRVPDAEVLIRFQVSGPGELAAQASGSPNQPASFRASECATFQGRCLAILRPAGSPGEIRLRAKVEGLESGTVQVLCRGFPQPRIP